MYSSERVFAYMLCRWIANICTLHWEFEYIYGFSIELIKQKQEHRKSSLSLYILHASYFPFEHTIFKLENNLFATNFKLLTERTET